MPNPKRARVKLPDGREAMLIEQPPEAWDRRRFDVQIDDAHAGFVVQIEVTLGERKVGRLRYGGHRGLRWVAERGSEFMSWDTQTSRIGALRVLLERIERSKRQAT